MKTFYEVDGRIYNTLEMARKDHFRNCRPIIVHNCTSAKTIEGLKARLYIPGFCEIGSVTFNPDATIRFLAADGRI